MAVVTKKFVAKHGLKVEGTEGLEVTSATATVGTFDVLTKKQADQDYIVGLIGGTSTSANTPDSVVKRDENGDFAAGTITADLTGNAETATALETARTIELTGDVTGSVSFDGTANVQISSTIAGISGDAVGTTDTQTLTNKTISGTDNTITDIANASLVNDSITINGTATALGGSVTLDTGDIQEDGNLYFTDTRARDAVSAGSGLEYNSSTGEFAADLGFGLQFDVNSQISVDGTVIATDQDVTDAFNAHNVSSGVHGVTGNIVGTTDTQTLSNKTLGNNLDADGNTVTNLADPVNAQDAATKNYVDGAVAGLNWKESVNLLADSNISLTGTTGTLVIDGHDALDVNDGGIYRLLLTGQTNDSENGIYLYGDDGSAYTLTRSADADTYQELDGAAVFVKEGTSYGSTSWVQTDHYMTDFSGQNWTQFSGQGTYLAGNGLTLTGNEFAINTAVTATREFATGEVTTHNNLTTGVHGVTGSVVGTTDSQTLTNKTLGSGTVLSANVDAVNTYTIANLADPSGAKDAATKQYVDDAVSGGVGAIDTDDVPEGINNLYFTDARAKTSAADLLTNATLSNITITGDGSGLTITAENGVADSDTDDLAEGATNLYFTDERAQDAVAAAIAAGTHENITITYDDATNRFTFAAENGVADSTTTDLTEGTNLYFTNARAVTALEAVVPNFTEIDINEVATQVASASSGNASEQVTAYAFSKDSYRSAKFLVKVAYGTHTEVSEVLLTLDTSDNIAITEYAVVGTNGSASTISAGINGTNVELYVTPANNTSTIKVMGTLLV